MDVWDWMSKEIAISVSVGFKKQRDLYILVCLFERLDIAISGAVGLKV